jgi:ABC-type phosphate transport system substrate-binding protein
MLARGTLLGLALAAALALAAPLGAEEIVVIVHPERAATLSTHQLAQIYLKQRNYWGNGERIVAVNLESASAVRAVFARAVLGQSPPQLSIYWNRQYFLGVMPPATLASDEAVKQFVAREKRAIGYIRASALDDSVRVAFRLQERSPPPPRD